MSFRLQDVSTTVVSPTMMFCLQRFAYYDVLLTKPNLTKPNQIPNLALNLALQVYLNGHRCRRRRRRRQRRHRRRSLNGSRKNDSSQNGSRWNDVFPYLRHKCRLTVVGRQDGSCRTDRVRRVQVIVTPIFSVWLLGPPVLIKETQGV